MQVRRRMLVRVIIGFAEIFSLQMGSKSPKGWTLSLFPTPCIETLGTFQNRRSSGPSGSCQRTVLADIRMLSFRSLLAQETASVSLETELKLNFFLWYFIIMVFFSRMDESSKAQLMVTQNTKLKIWEKRSIGYQNRFGLYFYPAIPHLPKKTHTHTHTKRNLPPVAQVNSHFDSGNDFVKWPNL